MALFRSLWIGAALSPFERLCIQSFLAHGHAFELFVYHPVANVPAGCRVANAREILPENQVFAYREGGSYAAFANWFRYKLLFDLGGWWVDADVVCLASEIPHPPIALARQDATLVNNAILKFPAGHPAMQFAYDTAVARGRNVKWGQAGPKLVTQIVQRFDLERWLAPSQSFYPISWQQFAVLLRPSKRDAVAARTAGATFLHLWNDMFRRAGYNKDCRPPAGSYLRELFDRHPLRDDFEFEYQVTESGDDLRLEMQRINPAVKSADHSG
jgi:hypothetical protein